MLIFGNMWEHVFSELKETVSSLLVLLRQNSRGKTLGTQALHCWVRIPRGRGVPLSLGRNFLKFLLTCVNSLLCGEVACCHLVHGVEVQWWPHTRRGGANHYERWLPSLLLPITCGASFQEKWRQLKESYLLPLKL